MKGRIGAPTGTIIHCIPEQPINKLRTKVRGCHKAKLDHPVLDSVLLDKIKREEKRAGILSTFKYDSEENHRKTI